MPDVVAGVRRRNPGPPPPRPSAKPPLPTSPPIVVHVCSLVHGRGHCRIAGKEWRWEFHSYLGPTFVGVNGEPLKNQPGEGHPVWPHFNAWLKEWESKGRAR